MEATKAILEKLGLSDVNSGAGTGGVWLDCSGDLLESVSPIDGGLIASVRQASAQDYEGVTAQACEAFLQWRMTPGPKRGELVRQIGDTLRTRKRELAALLTLEVGKIRAEAEGEVQEMIDVCDLAVGQSRMLYGLTMHSERPLHRMYEQWHPLGPIGVITAFNFPVAVWAWNAMMALIAGDTVIWKPSSKACLTAIAVMKIIDPLLQENDLPQGLLNIVIGGRSDVGERLIADRRLPLISATGSVAMGRHIGRVVAARLGKSLLELGGNNAVIVTAKADLDLVVRAILFGAVGTAGQRCTTIRRIIAHRDIFTPLAEALTRAYSQVKIGNPMEDGVLMGPLIDRAAVSNMQKAIETLKMQGGRVIYGGKALSGGIYDQGAYVTPCICEANHDHPIIQ
jgi:aldehyde dehydrogenase (NAD+)